ncbi:uncharacterized protein LOC132703484 [Cylas formicarius]|uniref:uncharacterized protein LOC132703484 n=1 Tax=Cylas formicarius TaxID=197179 RepID=UPI00295880A1|nr:uncharacterized protein LOC132703484 [Cylas formicarius]
MASITSEYGVSEDNSSDFHDTWDDAYLDRYSENSDNMFAFSKPSNLANNVINRQTYGRFTKHPRAKTEKAFHNIHTKCRYSLSSLIKDPEALGHIFMGFTTCGQYFLSYTERVYDDPRPQTVNRTYMFNEMYEYELYIWRFLPGSHLQFTSKHKIFKHLNGAIALDKVMFMQFPGNLHKIVCYGLEDIHNPVVHISILTLPSPKSCVHCHGKPVEDLVHRGWCARHGFVVHFMFSMTPPAPAFDPHVSMSFPDHLVINTVHHIYIVNVDTSEPVQATANPLLDAPAKCNPAAFASSDTFSELSESPSDHFGYNSVVDSILEDFNEYDLESNEGNKPFHELNISCEPLNVTGKSYHNALVQNIFDPRIKRLQNPIKVGLTSEKSKIDKKIAEKAYEFIEENEKYEKISLFRKKRLADKKYEFSEDNTENIVPFHILRRERRYLYRSQGRCVRSPDTSALFLSPRSSGWRSPMQSPNSRNGQFSPGGARSIYPHHSKSPVSPKEAARKFNVYSPSLDSDCSDSDSRLILRAPVNCSADCRFNHGLLIVDPKVESPKWIRKVVRRFSNGDFENSSLLSGQSRDDYNIPIEIPLLVQSLNEQQMDILPDCKADHVPERHIIVTQRSMDCEQFMQRRAQALCSEAKLDFMHCEDYDVKIIYVCPLNGLILCQAVIKIGAAKACDSNPNIENYTAHFLFTWNITTDAFDVIEPGGDNKLFPTWERHEFPPVKVPRICCNGVLAMGYDVTESSKYTLKDHRNEYEVCLRDGLLWAGVQVVRNRPGFPTDEYLYDSGEWWQT